MARPGLRPHRAPGGGGGGSTGDTGRPRRRLRRRLRGDKVVFQFSSVALLCATLCNPMGCSMPGLPVHHQLSQFTQTHVH